MTKYELRRQPHAPKRIAALVFTLLPVTAMAAVTTVAANNGDMGGSANHAGVGAPTTLKSPEVKRAIHADTSRPLRDVASAPPCGKPAGEVERENLINSKVHPPRFAAVDPVLQSLLGPLAMPAPITTFLGYEQQDNFDLNNGLGVLPPDTECPPLIAT